MIKMKSRAGLTVLAFLAIYLIWGSTYLAIRIAIETIPPLLMAGVRFGIAGSVLYAIGLHQGVGKPTREQWRTAFILGGLMLLMGNGLVTLAEEHLSSGMAAMLVATEPLWIVLLQWSRTRRYPGHQVVAGFMLGFAGMLFLTNPTNLGTNIDMWAVGAVILATLGWAVGSLYSKSAKLPSSSLLAVSMQMLAGSVLLLTTGVLKGEVGELQPEAISATSVFAMLYLAVFGSMIAFSAYVWLLKVTTPARVATYAYVNPVIAVFVGWFLGNETLTIGMLLPFGMIIGAVILIATQKPTEDSLPQIAPTPQLQLQEI